jgi:N-acetylmuramoyl-L-alanine amidase
LAKDFEQATAYFNAIKNNKERAATQENWDKALDNFQKIHDRQPSSTFAGASLFMLGRITYSRYKQFHNPIDLELSLKYYQQVSTIFPWHQLADDALSTQARIQLKDKKNPQEAARLYSRITTEYYTGDLMDQSMEKLKSLAKEYHTPLPPAKTSVSTKPANGSQTSASDSQPVSTEGDPGELPNVKNRSYVLPVKYWSSNNYTRIVINTSRPVSYKEELLEKAGDQPRRLFIDFDKSYIEPKYRAPIPIKDGLLQQVRTAQFSPDTVRVVLDIESIESYKIYSLPDPFRVIVDVHGQNATIAEKTAAPEPQAKDGQVSQVPGTAQEQPQARDGQVSRAPGTAQEQPQARDGQVSRVPGTAQERPQSGEPAAENEPILIPQEYQKIKFSKTSKQPASEQNAPIPSSLPSLAQQLNLGVRRIVIDPGHGGKDPGASAFGLTEKDIVLGVAKKLAAKLKQEMGYEVILTRNDDTSLSLEERTAIANTNNADLFISLHLNAHPSAKIFGFETYYLNLSTDPEAIRVAALENATSTHQLSDLQTILSDIMKNTKIDESSRLAKQVQDTLTSGLTDRKYTQVKSLGVKQAPFYVLIGAEMPAILIELAFISNKIDAGHVKKESYQGALADEIAAGIQKYIRTMTASL